jgi:hypothetical protein
LRQGIDCENRQLAGPGRFWKPLLLKACLPPRPPFVHRLRGLFVAHFIARAAGPAGNPPQMGRG